MAFLKFDPNQPRAEDGKWTDGGASAGGKSPSEPQAQSIHELTEKFKDYARGLQDKARLKDQVVTPTLEDVAGQVGGKMIGLEHRIKEKTGRIAEKMAENAIESGLTPEQAKETVYDSLRYTMELDPDSYAAGAERTLAALKEKGFSVYDHKDKNYWSDGSAYKGLNYVMTDKDGFKFELQFHTKQSMDVKMRNHSLYEAFRRPGTDGSTRKSLYNQMLSNWSAVQTPRGVERIGRRVSQTISL